MTVKIVSCAFIVGLTLALVALCAFVKDRRIGKFFNALGVAWVSGLISAYAYFVVL